MAQEPEKKQKETKQQIVIDTTSVSIAVREVQDSIAMQQRKVLKELDKRIEEQKKK